MTTLTNLVAAPGWWHIEQADGGAWLRLPLVGFALVEDPGVPAYVAALQVERGGQLVEVVPPVGRLVHETELTPCTCSAPTVAVVDAGWCRACAGLVAP